MAYDKSNLTLFSNKGASGKQPIMRGWVELKANELRYVANEMKAGRTGRLKVSVWKQTAKNSGQPFLSGSIEPEDAPKPKANDFNIDDFTDTSGMKDDLIL